MKIFLSFILTCGIAFSLEIKQKPIDFGKKRVSLTKEYIKKHYNLDAKDIKITPKIIFIHYTATKGFDYAYSLLKPEKLTSLRKDIANASSLNVSAHFMVDRDGSIYQLMPLNYMARHVIGLNYNSIGIENVGGKGDKEDLTIQQLISNILLINYLKKKFNTIEYVAGHYEYECFRDNELWLELDDNYRTKKKDPGEIFMRDIRANIKGFKEAPCL